MAEDVRHGVGLSEGVCDLFNKGTNVFVNISRREWSMPG